MLNMGCGASAPTPTGSDPAPVAPTEPDPAPVAPTEPDPAPLAPTEPNPAPVAPTEPDPAPVALTAARPAGGAMQHAFVFTKPHANTQAVREVVLAKFGEVGIEVVTEGEIDGPTIDSKKLIDQHYYAIASKATLLPPAELPVPADKFSEKFGEEWSTVLAEGRAYNALGACEHLGIDATQLKVVWDAATTAGKLVKLGGGFYCGLLEPEDKAPIYCFNAFFMSMRGKFTAADASIHYYVVRFDPSTLAWADFRGKVLGPTDPAKAPEGSLRGMLMARWEELGLEGAPNTTDNGVHASASPFEGLAERMNWLQVPLAEDEFGKQLLAAGMSEEMIKAWSVDPQVAPHADLTRAPNVEVDHRSAGGAAFGEGEKGTRWGLLTPHLSAQVALPGGEGKQGSLFDQLEDLDLAECLSKAVELSKAQS